MIIPDRAASVNPFSQTFSKTLRISMIIAKGGAHSLFILSKGQTFRRYSGSPLEAKNALSQGARNGRLRRPGNAVPTARGKRGQGHRMVPLPLLHPPPGGGNAHAMSWRISPVPGGRLSPPAASRCIDGTAYPLLRVKKEGRSSPPTAKIKPFSPASAPQRISRSVCRSDTQHPSAQWFRRASVRRSMQ